MADVGVTESCTGDWPIPIPLADVTTESKWNIG